MDKITHQIRAEHRTKILNECINSRMSKTAWCRANGISEKQLLYWERILRKEVFENSKTSSLPATAGSHQSLVSVTQGTVSFTEIKLPSSPRSANRQLSTTRLYYLHLIMEYLPGAGYCVDKYSKKLKNS